MAEDVNVSAPAAEPTPSAPPAAATPAAPASPVATPQATPAPAIPGAGPGEGWVPSYRVRETREAAQREAQTAFAQREYAYQQELQRIQNQLHALVGVQPPQNPETQAVRDQFGNLYPGLARIEERADDIMRIIERAGELEAQNDHYWQSYGKQSMDRLFSHASESLGAPINDEAKRQLHASFIGFVQSSPELTERYANDPSIIEDFWKAFTSSFIDPIRRTSTANVVGRANLSGALPQDTPSGAPHVTPGPQPKNLDERADAAWALYNATKKP